LTPEARVRRQRHNRIECAILLIGMALLLGAIGWLIAGPNGVIIAVAFGTGTMVIGRKVSNQMMLRAVGAKPVDWGRWPVLDGLVIELASRAGLPLPPRIFLLPAPMMIAFTVGNRADDAKIVLSERLLHGMSVRELAAVLAHEMGHIRSNDIFVMGLADSVTHMTRVLSLLGLLLVLFNVPLFALGEDHVPWQALALLVFAPHLSMLLQMALSRSREFDADRAGVSLTGDPQGLAVALTKLERHQINWFEQLTGYRSHAREPSLLRSHPETDKRIAVLMAETPDAVPLPGEFMSDEPVTSALGLPAPLKRFAPFFSLWR
jgi:heat shock protein HtpX